MQSYRVVAVGDPIAAAVTYDAFNGKERLPLPGPVFIHEDECRRYPEDAGFPAQLRSRELTLNAYAAGRRLIAQRYVSNGIVEPELRDLLMDREVSYIHVRDTQAGCYDFCIERTDDEEGVEQNTRSAGGASHE